MEPNATGIPEQLLDFLTKDSRLQGIVSREEAMYWLIGYLWHVHKIKWPTGVLEEGLQAQLMKQGYKGVMEKSVPRKWDHYPGIV